MRFDENKIIKTILPNYSAIAILVKYPIKIKEGRKSSYLMKLDF
jgi:hypothetical protein